MRDWAEPKKAIRWCVFFAARGEVFIFCCEKNFRSLFGWKVKRLLTYLQEFQLRSKSQSECLCFSSKFNSQQLSFMFSQKEKNSTLWFGVELVLRYYLFHFTCASTISFFKYINTNNYFGLRASKDFFSLLSQRLSRITSSLWCYNESSNSVGRLNKLYAQIFTRTQRVNSFRTIMLTSHAKVREILRPI